MAGNISSAELVALFAIVTASLFWIWMLLDCVRNRNLTDGQRTYWVVLIALTHVLGALSYLINRPRHRPVGSTIASRVP